VESNAGDGAEEAKVASTKAVRGVTSEATEEATELFSEALKAWK